MTSVPPEAQTIRRALEMLVGRNDRFRVRRDEAIAALDALTAELARARENESRLAEDAKTAVTNWRECEAELAQARARNERLNTAALAYLQRGSTDAHDALAEVVETTSEARARNEQGQAEAGSERLNALASEGVTRWRKKPVVIEAVRYPLNEWADNPLTFAVVPEWLKAATEDGTIRPEFRSEDYWYLVIKTLEGEMTVTPDDWIIRGVKGEIYPCKPDIFAATYEPASLPVPAPVPLSPAVTRPERPRDLLWIAAEQEGEARRTGRHPDVERFRDLRLFANAVVAERDALRAALEEVDVLCERPIATVALGVHVAATGDAYGLASQIRPIVRAMLGGEAAPPSEELMSCGHPKSAWVKILREDSFRAYCGACEAKLGAGTARSESGKA